MLIRGYLIFDVIKCQYFFDLTRFRGFLGDLKPRKIAYEII